MRGGCLSREVHLTIVLVGGGIAVEIISSGRDRGDLKAVEE